MKLQNEKWRRERDSNPPGAGDRIAFAAKLPGVRTRRYLSFPTICHSICHWPAIGALAILTGCGGGMGGTGTQDNLGLGWTFTEQSTATGIKARYANGNSVGVAEIDRIYAETVTCSKEKVDVAPQYVLFEAGVKARFGKEGDYIDRSMTVAIDAGVSYGDAERLLRHEFVHHIRYVTTGDSDAKHASGLFGNCADPAIH